MSNNTDGLKKSSLFHILIIITLAIGLYSNTLKNGFVYDDNDTILKNNTLIKSFDNLPLLLDKTAYFNRSGEMSYRPVVTITYFIDYVFYGLKPWGYHLTNVLLHAINGVLLYIFLTLLLTPGTAPILHSGTGFQPVPPNMDNPLSHSSRFMSLPFFISLLFVAHPVLTEAVNCISYREDLLAFLFYMTTLSLYLILIKPATDHRPPATTLFYLLSCLTYLLALLSKEMAVTLPLIILCYEWLYGRKKTKLLPRLFNRHIIGYIAITLFYLYLRFYLFHNPKEQIQAWGLLERFLTFPWLIMSYLKLSLFPVHLSADYVIVPVGSPFSLNFILSIIVIVSIFTIIVIMGNRQRSILFGALFFLITLTPVYNIAPIANPFAERYIYLPVIGCVMSAVYIVFLVAEKYKAICGYKNLYVPIFFIVILITFSFSIVNRNAIWKDNYSLWFDTVAKMPNSREAHYNLGIAYSRQGLFDLAINEYLTIVSFKPDDALVHYNLGVAYYKLRRYDDAISEFNTALKWKPDFKEAYIEREVLMEEKKGYKHAENATADQDKTWSP